MATERVDRAVTAYGRLHPQLVTASVGFVERVRAIVDEAGINYLTIEGRAKTAASFAAKALRLQQSDPGADPRIAITDQIGVRVITYVAGDVLAVASLLAEHFTILDDRDMGRETASEGRFGYASRHLIASVNPDATVGYSPLTCASIQLRTVLQHAWAEFEHDIRYKGTVPPEQVPDLDRRFTLAAGLLELADREFSTIRDRLQEGLGERHVASDDSDPRISPQQLATFLAGRYASAGWSRTEHYEWMTVLLLQLGIGSLDELSDALRDIDSASITAAMEYRFPPGAVRRLDDDLLARFGDRYAALPDNAHRREALANRLHRIDAPG